MDTSIFSGLSLVTTASISYSMNAAESSAKAKILGQGDGTAGPGASEVLSTELLDGLGFRIGPAA